MSQVNVTNVKLYMSVYTTGVTDVADMIDATVNKSDMTPMTDMTDMTDSRAVTIDTKDTTIYVKHMTANMTEVTSDTIVTCGSVRM